MLYDSQYFEGNCDLYADYDSLAAVKLSLLDCEHYSFVYTHSGELNLCRTVDEQVFYFHSQQSIKEEVDGWFRAIRLEQHPVVVIYGLGLGYYFHKIKAWLEENPERLLIIFEHDLCVVKRFFETDRAEELLLHPQVILQVVHKSKFYDDLEALTRGVMTQTCYITALQTYSKLYAEFIIEIRNQIFSMINHQHTIFTELIISRKQIFTNFYKNILSLNGCYHFGILQSQLKDIPCIICGAGPSIKKDLDLLKEMQDRAIIVGSGSGMNVINHAGIFAHFGPGLDPTESQRSRIRTNFAFETPYIFRTRFNYEAREILHGPKIFIRGFSGFDIGRWFEDKLDLKNEPEIRTGISSTNYSLEFMNALGCNPIITLGLDLCYQNQSRYAQGVRAHPSESRRQHSELTAQQDRRISGCNYRGESVLTKFTWNVEASLIEEFAERNPHLEVINATDGGLKIRSIPFQPFDELCQSRLLKQYDLRNLVHALIQNASVSVDIDERIDSMMQDWMASLKRLVHLFEALVKEINRLIEHALSGKTVNLKPHNGTIALLEFDVYQEPAYQYLICEYASLIKRMSTRNRINAKRLRSTYSDSQRVLKELEIDFNYYIFFMENTIWHYELCRQIFEEKKREDQLDSHPIADALYYDSASSEKGTYQFDGSHLKILEESLGIDLEDSFVPEIDESYYESGELFYRMHRKEGCLHGPAYFFTKERKILAVSWYYEGNKEGVSRQFYQSNKPYSIQFFRGNKWEGEQYYYYESGIVKSIIPFEAGVLNGCVRLYYPNGQLKRSLEFENGCMHGFEKMWSEEGVLLIEAHYDEGRECGMTRRWYPNGQLKREVLFHEKSDEFDYREWDPNGRLIREAFHTPLTKYNETIDKKRKIHEALASLKKDLFQYDYLSSQERDITRY